MSTWRRKAIEVLPGKREIIEEAESPMALWIYLWLEFETAAKQNENATVRAVLDYGRTCRSGARQVSSRRSNPSSTTSWPTPKSRGWRLFYSNKRHS